MLVTNLACTKVNRRMDLLFINLYITICQLHWTSQIKWNTDASYNQPSVDIAIWVMIEFDNRGTDSLIIYSDVNQEKFHQSH